jgi:uncharacterized DUF497 family protein
MTALTIYNLRVPRHNARESENQQHANPVGFLSRNLTVQMAGEMYGEIVDGEKADCTKAGQICKSPVRLGLWYNSYTGMRFQFDERKSKQLRANPKRGIGFEEAQEIFSHAYYLDQRNDLPEQYRAIGWAGERLYALIFEVREDQEGEYYHLVTLWRATSQEQQLYEEHS